MGAVGVAAVLLAAGSGVAATVADAAAPAAAVRVGSAPAVPGGSTAVAAPSDNQKLDLSVSLKPRNQSALDGFVKAVSTPGTPAYHQYLSKGQFAATFGPSQATITAAENALKSQGLTVTGVSSDGLTISVSTTVAGAESAFAIGFAGYHLANGRTVYANTSAPQLSAAVAPNVEGVVGLDDIVTPTSNVVASGHQTAPAAQHNAVKPNSEKAGYSAPTVCSSFTSALNTNGWYDGQEYYSPAALANIYGTTGDLSAGDNGSGISVGVFELEGIDTPGYSQWTSCLGTTTPLSIEKVDGGATGAVNAADNTGVESALDVDTIAGLAPGVSIIDYEGPDARNATDANVLDTYQKMVTDDTVQVISSSWGECELDSDAPLLTAESTVFQEAAAQGQSVVAASGDQGSTSCYGDTNSNGTSTGHDASLSVDDPASQPDVLGVGGTSMHGLTPTGVAAWNTDAPYPGSTGGGVSADWPLFNGAYQVGFKGAGYNNACNAGSGYTCRQVPDVSALADPAEGYLLDTYISDSDGTGDYVFIVGGTSGAAPVWASVLALADASAACSSVGPVGFVNPALYASQASATAKSGVITDVTAGNNVLAGSGYTGSDYQAGVGYDLTTGLGTPLAGGVTSDLCGAVVPKTASYFVPENPAPIRILDTRSNLGHSGKIAANGVAKIQVGNANGIPSGVTAVVLNLTATDTTGNGFLTAYPDGSLLPNSSNVNFSSGQTVANLAIVPVGADGAVDVYNGGGLSGPLDVIGDVSGYFVASSAVSGSATYHALSPVRVIDTRSGLNGVSGQLAANGTDSLKIDGLSGVSPSATAVVAHITVTNTGGNGFITAFPAGGSLPNVSSVNFGKGQTVENSSIIPVGAGGEISFTNSGATTGPTDLIVDISGYFTTGTGGDVYHATSPYRILDTRYGVGAPQGQIGSNATLALSLGRSGTAVPSSAAVVANLTVTGTGGNGFITAYPSSLGTEPNISTVNFEKGQTVPNLAIITNTNGVLDFTNSGALTGPTDLIVDVAGYFSAS